MLNMSDDSDETQEFHPLKLKYNTIKETEQDVHISDSQSLCGNVSSTWKTLF